jgi:ABC-type phosphate transport system substrate-binding protein
MEAFRRRPSRLFARVAFYTLVMAAVFIWRGQSVKRGTGIRFPTESDTVKTITLTGRELAPALMATLVSNYQRQYPDLHVVLDDGGTTRALEALANGNAAVGLLYRPPTGIEQSVIYGAVDDSVIYFPVALGGIVVFGHPESGLRMMDVDDLRRFVRGDVETRFERFYVPDPNQGLWDALQTGLGFSSGMETPSKVVFLADEAAVVQTVAGDRRGMGIGSTLTLPDNLEPLGVRLVTLRPDAGGAAVAPGYEQIGYGEYPLYHYLYIACLANASVRGAMFVTYVTSDRGQRQIERAGFLPARQTLRPIQLTRDPIGSK